MRALGLLGAAGLVAGCRRRRSPEERARAWLARMEDAVEERDLTAIRELVSARFRGPEDLDRGQAMLLLRARLAGKPAIHLLTRVLDVHAQGELVRMEVVAAMAAVPLHGPDELPRIEADIYRWKLELGDDDGELRVTAASWEPARVPDFQ